MSWTRCVASMVLRLREGAPSTQQTLPSSPGGRAGFPALSGTQARLLTPRGAGWCVSPPLPPHRGCVSTVGVGRLQAVTVAAAVMFRQESMAPPGCVSPACPGWNPGIVGWASVPPSVFPAPPAVV